MIRAFASLLMLAAVVAVAGWFALKPGNVSVAWLGWHIEAPVGYVLAALFLATLLLLGLWKLLAGMIAAPGRLRAWRARKRAAAGHAELTRGMIAVAAGDVAAARLAANRANRLAADDDAALALLLTAQSAQLAGDDQEAARAFEAMLARPETEFIGLRGLLAQANRSGERQKAMTLAKRAYGLKPDAPWLLATLFDLSLRQGDWRTAEDVLARGERRRVFARDQVHRHSALLAYLRSREAELAEDLPVAISLARKAHKFQPSSAPLAEHAARLLIAEGARREAAKTIEATWPLAPSASLAALYLEARYEPDPLKAYGRMERLAKLAPEHLESRLALARAAMAAKLWGAARGQLAAATSAENDPPARAWRLFAELERAEHHDEAAATRALDHAAAARPDEAWTCRECQARTPDWSPLCPSCDAFDSLDWTSPAPVTALALTHEAPAVLPTADAPQIPDSRA